MTSGHGDKGRINLMGKLACWPEGVKLREQVQGWWFDRGGFLI